MGFQKAKPLQAALKMALYGAQGSGKTFTALLIAEGLAKMAGKRIAFVDTERGSDFYALPIDKRAVHPEAFDFDALYERSLMTVLREVKNLDPKEYCCIVIDSMTHLWNAAREAYGGRVGPNGQIPIHAWGKIKKPYKDLVHYLINSPFHVIFCGRQGVDFQEDDDGEMKNRGTKMKAEGETPYEPNLLLHMENQKQGVNQPALIAAFAEKDRSGILAGRWIKWPNFENVAEPILRYLGVEQAQLPDSDEVSAVDIEEKSKLEEEKVRESTAIHEQYSARMTLARSQEELKAIGAEITPKKKRMVPQDVKSLGDRYREILPTLPETVDPLDTPLEA